MMTFSASSDSTALRDRHFASVKEWRRAIASTRVEEDLERFTARHA
jgi:hypothetical protein